MWQRGGHRNFKPNVEHPHALQRSLPCLNTGSRPIAKLRNVALGWSIHAWMSVVQTAPRCMNSNPLSVYQWRPSANALTQTIHDGFSQRDSRRCGNYGFRWIALEGGRIQWPRGKTWTADGITGYCLGPWRGLSTRWLLNAPTSNYGDQSALKSIKWDHLVW